MLASRLGRCARLPPLPISPRTLPKHSHPAVARQVRNYAQTPFRSRSRYVRFGASGPEDKGQGKGNPWDWRHWDTQTRLVAGFGAFAAVYYVAQYVCVPLPLDASVRACAGLNRASFA